MTPAPTSEQAARLLKAIALTDLLDAGGITAEDASYLDASDWLALAKAAQIRPPSPATCALVIDFLGRREVARTHLNLQRR
jgi:hypothetical protein